MRSESDNHKNLLCTPEEIWRILHANATSLKQSVDIAGIATREKSLLDEQMKIFLRSAPAGKFERSTYGDVRSFFDEACKDYDSDLENPYWSFTHEILKFILRKFIVEHFSETQEIRLFDAGAGTGNWSAWVLRMNPRTCGTLFDMNANMLKVAYAKIIRLHGNATRIVEGDLEVTSDFPSERSNLILCMHNVIGLGRNTERILRNLFLHLEEGGLAFIMAMNKYHAFNFTRRFRDETEALRVLGDGSVKFKSDMPEMFCYTPNELHAVLMSAGFNEVTVLGFPVTAYPSPQDTKLLQKETLDQQLTNAYNRAMLLKVEKRLCLYPELAYRGGSSLIAICKKNADQ